MTWHLGRYLGYGDEEPWPLFAARVEREVIRYARSSGRQASWVRQRRLRARKRLRGLCASCALSRQEPAVRAGYCLGHYQAMAARRRAYDARRRRAA